MSHRRRVVLASIGSVLASGCAAADLVGRSGTATQTPPLPDASGGRLTVDASLDETAPETTDFQRWATERAREVAGPALEERYARRGIHVHPMYGVSVDRWSNVDRPADRPADLVVYYSTLVDRDGNVVSAPSASPERVASLTPGVVSVSLALPERTYSTDLTVALERVTVQED